MVAVDHICIFFASAVSCEAMSGSSVSSFCKCCKGAVCHGRLPVFIVQTNFVNAQGKNWTGEKIIGTTWQKHIAKMPGCRVSRHPGISSQITGQASSVQHSVQLPLPPVDPVNLPNSIHWMILNARRVSRNARPFRDWIKFCTTDHRAECFSFYPYYRTHLFDECV